MREHGAIRPMMAFAREPNGARRAVALICILSGSPLHTGQTRFSGEQFSKSQRSKFKMQWYAVVG